MNTTHHGRLKSILLTLACFLLIISVSVDAGVSIHNHRRSKRDDFQLENSDLYSSISKPLLSTPNTDLQTGRSAKDNIFELIKNGKKDALIQTRSSNDDSELSTSPITKREAPTFGYNATNTNGEAVQNPLPPSNANNSHTTNVNVRPADTGFNPSGVPQNINTAPNIYYGNQAPNSNRQFVGNSQIPYNVAGGGTVYHTHALNANPQNNVPGIGGIYEQQFVGTSSVRTNVLAGNTFYHNGPETGNIYNYPPESGNNYDGRVLYPNQQFVGANQIPYNVPGDRIVYHPHTPSTQQKYISHNVAGSGFNYGTPSLNSDRGQIIYRPTVVNSGPPLNGGPIYNTDQQAFDANHVPNYVSTTTTKPTPSDIWDNEHFITINTIKKIEKKLKSACKDLTIDYNKSQSKKEKILVTIPHCAAAETEIKKILKQSELETPPPEDENPFQHYMAPALTAASTCALGILKYLHSAGVIGGKSKSAAVAAAAAAAALETAAAKAPTTTTKESPKASDENGNAYMNEALKAAMEMLSKYEEEKKKMSKATTTV